MDLLDSMKVYVLTIEKGSLSAAAEVCGMSATMAGNHVRSLEQRLGMQLMHRTTRRQHVTAFGADYYARCKEILRLVAETDAQAQSMRLAPAGTLRVSAPVTFGTEALTPALSDYLARYPEVDVELDISDRIVDLMDDGCEAAIRMGWDEIIGSDGLFVGMTGFGASAPYKDLYRHFGITAEAIVAAATAALGEGRGAPRKERA